MFFIFFSAWFALLHELATVKIITEWQGLWLNAGKEKKTSLWEGEYNLS